MASNVLTLTVQVDNRTANRSIQNLNRDIGSIEKTAIQAGAGANRGFGAIEQGAVRASATIRSSFGGLNAIIGAVAASGLSKLGFAALKVGADFERSRLGIKAFVGDLEKSNKLFGEVQKFALESPFEFKELLHGTSRLLAFEFTAAEIPEKIKAISDAVGALGGDAGKVDDLVTALGQIKAAGRLTGEELRQLRNTGIPAVQILAKAFGETPAAIDKAIREGRLGAEEAIEALVGGMQEKFSKFGDELKGSASVAFSNFKDALQFFADDLTKNILPSVTEGIYKMRDVLSEITTFVSQNKSALSDVAVAIGEIGIAIVTYKVATGLQAVATALVAANGAALLNPFGLVAAGIAVIGIESYRSIKRLEELKEFDFKRIHIQDLIRGGATAAEMKEIGYSAKDIQIAFGGMRDIGKQAYSAIDYGIKVTVKGTEEHAKKLFKLGEDREAAVKKVLDAEKRASDILRDARLGEATGIGAIIRQHIIYNQEIGVSAKANRDLAEALQLRINSEAQSELKKNSGKVIDSIQEEYKERKKLDTERFQNLVDSRNEILELDTRTSLEKFAIEEQQLEAAKEKELRSIDVYNTKNVAAQIAASAKKAEIEEKYLLRSFEVKAKLLDEEAKLEVALEEYKAIVRGDSEEVIAAKRASIGQAAAIRAQKLTVETDSRIAEIRESAAKEQAQIVINENQRVFEDAKRSIDGIIDALISRDWKKIWQAVFLAPIKELFSSFLAKILTGFTGQISSGTASGSGGGLFGRIAGLGGLGAVGGFGAAGAPGGTPGFAGPVGGLGGAKGGFGGLASNFAGYGASLKSFLGFGSSSISTGAGTATTTATLGGKLTALGKSDAALAAGIALGADGLRRGGKLGLAETTGGGALIGFRFGGPVGAAIGAAAGFAAGTIRLFIKGAVDKIVEKTKSIYGITISKEFANNPLLGIIKQNFGGDINVGLQSSQVRDLIELYSMSTGQSPNGGFAQTLRPVSLIQNNGSIRQTSDFQNGTALTNPGLNLNQSSASLPNVTYVLDPDATKNFWETQTINVVQSNPRVIQGAASAAQRENFDRRPALNRLVNPSMITA